MILARFSVLTSWGGQVYYRIPSVTLAMPGSETPVIPGEPDAPGAGDGVEGFGVGGRRRALYAVAVPAIVVKDTLDGLAL
jgi:hypothetical protein